MFVNCDLIPNDFTTQRGIFELKYTCDRVHGRCTFTKGGRKSLER